MQFDLITDDPPQASADALANRRLIGGILVSLFLHALILSLHFGIPGLELPSLEAPWKERRKPVEALRVDIASPAPKALPVPPTPTVTVPELFKLPTPILPAPTPKKSVVNPGGIVVLAQPQVILPPDASKTKKKTKLKPQTPISELAAPRRVPPPTESPTRIIAQDQIKNDDFVVPLTSEEELERDRHDQKEQKKKLEAIPEDAVIDKTAELALLAEEKLQEELKQKKIEQEKKAAEQLIQQQKAQEQKERLLQQIAKAAEEKLREQAEFAAEQKAIELKRQQAEQIQQQRLLAQEKAAQAQKERELAMEESLREAKRQELLTQETLKQEEQRRQAEQKKQRQLAQEQELQRQEALAQAQLKQKQMEEQAQKKRVLEIAERQKREALEAQEASRLEVQRQAQIAEQRLQEQRLLEQKIAEQKIAEQKLAEQKALEQKIAQQRVLEQRLAEQRLAEQKLAEQKLAEQRAAEQRVAEQRLAEQRALAESKITAEREAALAAQRAAAANSFDAFGQGKGGAGAGASAATPSSSANRGDLASRLREQARNGDLLKSASPNTKALDEKAARRRSFLGAYDKEVPLRMYVDSLKQKLERNGNLIYEKRSLSNVEHNVLVNMVVRSDGSIEEVVILRSSGSRAIDEKARNIIMANSPFGAFPPALALKYDVIEIQRVWSFGDRLHILENLPTAF
ncbi:TonB C-terminal domain-containing protein [Undibacterium fentianense]|uniref:TonB C-terminal domain-containing protein n=1 Tax=Undibacterium fentianense TaxID=2828728 RepID=A0A941E0C5_9BURK|nr:TonB C-terminal domain-containing protein [Undibacterium fentianense]MBR7800095.1 TonB C-terminal domain-containing protein [Undibacterium fentianense]